MKWKKIIIPLVVILLLTPLITNVVGKNLTINIGTQGRYLEVSLRSIRKNGLSIGIEGITLNNGDTTEQVTLTTKIFKGSLSEYSEIELEEYRQTYYFTLEPGEQIEYGNYYASEIVNNIDRFKVLYVEFYAKSEDYPGGGCSCLASQEIWVTYINSNIQIMTLPGSIRNVNNKIASFSNNIFLNFISNLLSLRDIK